MVADNDSVVEIQLDLCIQQLRVPAWYESLLKSISDALLRALQRWITRHGYPMKSQCYVSLQAVETRCIGVLTNIPMFAFFPWTCNLARTMLALFDWLSYSWLMTQLQVPCMEFKLVIILIHENNSELTSSCN